MHQGNPAPGISQYLSDRRRVAPRFVALHNLLKLGCYLGSTSLLENPHSNSVSFPKS